MNRWFAVAGAAALLFASCRSSSTSELRELGAPKQAVVVDVTPASEEEVNSTLSGLRARAAPADARGPRYTGPRASRRWTSS